MVRIVIDTIKMVKKEGVVEALDCRLTSIEIEIEITIDTKAKIIASIETVNDTEVGVGKTGIENTMGNI